MLNRSQSDSGAGFLKNSKVGSASGFVVVAGSIMAIPHGKKLTAALPPTNRFVATSEYNERYREVPHCYASMEKKPLIPYHPEASRSRLAVEDAAVPVKNASTIEFKDIHCCHKRRWMTTHKNYHTGDRPDMRTNPAMIADSTRMTRILREM